MQAPGPETDVPSKTDVKRAMHELQDLGAALMELPESKLDRIEMDDNLRDALQELRRLTSHAARKRQVQYVGKLLRSADTEPLRKALADQRQGHARTVRGLQEIERWRERLLTGDRGLADWLAAHPASATAEFQSLLARARAEYGAHQAKDEIPGAASGKGKYYRALFQHIRGVLQPGSD